MSKRTEDYERSCAGKTPYGTEAAAKHSAAVRSHRYAVDLVVYRCRYGDHWHLGTRKLFGVEVQR